MAIKYLKSGLIKNKTVLLRLDVNEGVDSEGNLMDDFRLKASLPTIQMLYRDGNKVIICGHLGRPRGVWEESQTLRPVAERLAEMLKFKFVESKLDVPSYPVKHLILYTGNILEETHRKHIESISSKDIVILENIRFYSGEEENDPILGRRLAELADVYVNDAFSVSHRKQSSVVAVTKSLPSYAGPLMEKEIKSLSYVLQKAKSPFVVLMGGIKITEKAQTIEHLAKKADHILLGGGLANLFLMSQGLEVGHSKVEASGQNLVSSLKRSLKGKIMLPLDLVVADPSMDKSTIKVKPIYEVGKRDLILDLGPKTILAYSQVLKNAKTIVWNGPLGHFEVKPFDTATLALARVIGGVGKRKAYATVGGGETVDAVRLAGQINHIDHVSTGGGAMLEFLAGKKLPGIEALK